MLKASVVWSLWNSQLNKGWQRYECIAEVEWAADGQMLDEEADGCGWINRRIGGWKVNLYTT